MGKISFRLNKGITISDANKAYPIYLRFIIDKDTSFDGSTGFKVCLNDWNSEIAQIRNRSHLKYRHEINNSLSKLKEHFENLNIEMLVTGSKPTYKQAKIHFDKFFNRVKAVETPNLFQFIDQFIENAKVNPNPITKKLVAKCTISSYKRVTEILQMFNDEVYRIDFDKIDYEFYSDFNSWSENKNYSRNYIGKLTKTLKTFLNEATEQGINTNTAFQSKKFSVIKEDSDNIYLTMNELQSIWKLDLSNDKPTETARNLFLIGAYTGLRVSDYNQLDKSNFKTVNGVDLLQVKTQKTGKQVAIPLHPVVKAIIEQTPEILNKSISNPELNRLIKIAGKLAKIKEIESTTITKGGKEISTQLPKHQLITTHTARRSFCTNAYLMGMPTIDIMAISGHKSEKVFLNYIKASAEQKALKIAEHDFFKHGTNMKVV